MVNSRKRLLLLALVPVCILAALLVLSRHCPSAGLAFTTKARALHRLKNRTVVPQPADFNQQVSLSQLLKPGDDRSRWSTDHAARIAGYVIDVAYARPEATNCFLPCRRDIHILLANRTDAPKTEQVVLEVTPNFQESATQQGQDWSERSLRTQLLNRWCEFEGWLYWDEGHAEESKNIAPLNPSNWRATAWEIHPVTHFRVIPSTNGSKQ